MYRSPQRLFLPVCLLTTILLIAYLCLFLHTSIQFSTSPLYFYRGAYRVYPYFIRSREITEERITLVLHTSADALKPETLSTAIDNWKGPISIGIYFDVERDTMVDIREKMMETFRMLSDGSLATIVAVHLLCRASPELSNVDKRSAAYPINVVRNIARLFTTTRFLLIGDMDHLFSVGFERKMRDLALRTLGIGKKRVLVYRFFEIEEEESVARNHRIGKDDLKKLLNSDKAVVFHSMINMTNGHEIPKLEEWLASEEKERTGIFEEHLKYEKREWEPQIVFTRDAPIHDESFPYRIRNNLALRWEMCRAGYEFSLVDDLFVYHRGIVRFGSECFHKKESARRINIRRYLPILTIFKRKMDILYPSTKDECAIEDESRLY